VVVVEATLVVPGLVVVLEVVVELVRRGLGVRVVDAGTVLTVWTSGNLVAQSSSSSSSGKHRGSSPDVSQLSPSSRPRLNQQHFEK